MVEPFLAGVLAEEDGSSSAQFARLLIRSFLRGTPSVPSLGMARLPELVAAGLPADTIRLNQPVRAVDAGRVQTDQEEITASAVVVATDPRSAAVLTGIDEPIMKPLTTFWHTAAEAPSRRPFLHLDGDRRGPVVNTVVMTAAAPTYAPAGRPLIATTVLGADGSAEMELVVRTARRADLRHGSSELGVGDHPRDHRRAAGPAAAAAAAPAGPAAQRHLRRG